MHPDRQKWNSEVRYRAKHLLQAIHDEYEANGDMDDAAVVAQVMQRFKLEFYARPPGPRIGDRRTNVVRDAEVFALAEAGWTLREMGKHFGVSFQMIALRLKRVLRTKGLTSVGKPRHTASGVFSIAQDTDSRWRRTPAESGDRDEEE